MLVITRGYGKINATLLATLLTGDHRWADALRKKLGPRGITSLESSVLKDMVSLHLAEALILAPAIWGRKCEYLTPEFARSDQRTKTRIG
jgi:hypothetical protein